MAIASDSGGVKRLKKFVKDKLDCVMGVTLILLVSWAFIDMLKLRVFSTRVEGRYRYTGILYEQMLWTGRILIGLVVFQGALWVYLRHEGNDNRAIHYRAEKHSGRLAFRSRKTWWTRRSRPAKYTEIAWKLLKERETSWFESATIRMSETKYLKYLDLILEQIRRKHDRELDFLARMFLTIHRPEECPKEVWMKIYKKSKTPNMFKVAILGIVPESMRVRSGLEGIRWLKRELVEAGYSSAADALQVDVDEIERRSVYIPTSKIKEHIMQLPDEEGPMLEPMKDQKLKRSDLESDPGCSWFEQPSQSNQKIQGTTEDTESTGGQKEVEDQWPPEGTVFLKPKSIVVGMPVWGNELHFSEAIVPTTKVVTRKNSFGDPNEYKRQEIERKRKMEEREIAVKESSIKLKEKELQQKAEDASVKQAETRVKTEQEKIKLAEMKEAREEKARRKKRRDEINLEETPEEEFMRTGKIPGEAEDDDRSAGPWITPVNKKKRLPSKLRVL